MTGKQLLRCVTLEDSLAPVGLGSGSIKNPGTAAAETKEIKENLFQSIVSKVLRACQGGLMSPPWWRIIANALQHLYEQAPSTPPPPPEGINITSYADDIT